MMNAEEIIAYIRDAEKKTPVKVYVWEKEPVAFPNCHEFPAGENCKIVFGDWKDIGPVLKSQEFAHIEIENGCRNSAIPMLDLKDIPARIEPGAFIREQVTIEKNAVIMMGAILNIGAVVGEGTMIDMGAVLGGRSRSRLRRGPQYGGGRVPRQGHQGQGQADRLQDRPGRRSADTVRKFSDPFRSSRLLNGFFLSFFADLPLIFQRILAFSRNL